VPLAIGNIGTGNIFTLATFSWDKEDKGLRTKDKGGEKPSFVGCLLSVVLTEIFSALACTFAGILIT
jgi:hypothetical protein